MRREVTPTAKPTFLETRSIPQMPLAMCKIVDQFVPPSVVSSIEVPGHAEPLSTTPLPGLSSRRGPQN
jgi:hypothetical protein